jgi:hypothetical protein
MTGRGTIIGLSLLSALLFSVLGVQSASAAVSKNTTAFTCVKGGGNRDFQDAHCDVTVPAGTGEFGHVAIANGTETEIEVTNAKTKNSTTESTPATIKTIIAGAEVHIDCNTVSGTGAIKNSEPAAGEHRVSGKLIAELTNCTVTKPLNCTVSEPLVFHAAFEGVDGLNGAEKNMGLEFKPTTENELLMSIQFTGVNCPLKNLTFPLRGTAISTGTVAPNAKEAGATWKFGPEKEMEKLTLGMNLAELLGTLTPTMKGGGNPISLTTTT